MMKILVVDDEQAIRTFLRISLRAEGYEVLEAESGEQALVCCTQHAPELVLLDLGLPDMDGFEVLSTLRQWSQIPVLVVSARSQESEVVRLLEAGANDYVIKPFGIRELLARVRVLFRDYQQTPATQYIEVADLCLDLVNHKLLRGEQQIHLSKKEFTLFEHLARHAGKLVTQQTLLTAIWGETHKDDSHYLRVLVGQLRKKLGDDIQQPRYIETETGIGYRLRMDEG
ncbi:response regulator [Dongshaea marina]|uniref:response regulator n=1 Tax=Dongshaea marina TaxID=2047966 RepID=UPI000D3E58F9|nr:response regulator transcription factor [Dongshaea marina]